MMPLEAYQQVTLWRSTPNGFGGFTYGTPTPLLCRWVERAELVPGSATEISVGVVYLPVDVAINDYLLLGVSTASSPPKGAHRVRMFSRIPDLRNLQALRKAWLV